jgi:hypothetical protein
MVAKTGGARQSVRRGSLRERLVHSDSQKSWPNAASSRNCRARLALVAASSRRVVASEEDFAMSMFADDLPSKFPVGTRYVIEGRGGGQGALRIHLRYLEFPDGRHVDLPADVSHRARAQRRRRAGRRTARK